MLQCKKIRVDLKNVLLESQGERLGIYEKSAVGNEKPSWISNNQAIWWISQHNEWGIGDLNSLGTDIRGITGVTDDENKFGLPNDPKYTWKYWNGESFTTSPDANDINVECVDDETTTIVPNTAAPTTEGNDTKAWDLL